MLYCKKVFVEMCFNFHRQIVYMYNVHTVHIYIMKLKNEKSQNL